MPTLQEIAQNRYRLFVAHFRDGVSYSALARETGITKEALRAKVITFVDDMSKPGRKHLYRGFRLG